MAARYVNPDNVTAQGQYFYTGLLPGSYDTAGAGGGNVYGAGSGGSAGVSADRTGSDSKKTWDYQSKWQKPVGKSDKDEILDAIAGKGDPEASAPPDGGEDPPRGRRKGGGRAPYGPTSVGTPTGDATTGGMGTPLGTGTGLPGGPGTTPAAAGALKKRDDRNAARRAKTASDKADREAEIGRTGPSRSFEVHHDDGGDGVAFRPGIDKTVNITGPKSITQQGPGGGLATGSGTVHQAGSPMAVAASRSHSRPRTF